MKKGRENYRQVDVVNLNFNICSWTVSTSLMSPSKFHILFAFLSIVQIISEMKEN